MGKFICAQARAERMPRPGKERKRRRETTYGRRPYCRRGTRGGGRGGRGGGRRRPQEPVCDAATDRRAENGTPQTTHVGGRIVWLAIGIRSTGLKTGCRDLPQAGGMALVSAKGTVSAACFLDGPAGLAPGAPPARRRARAHRPPPSPPLSGRVRRRQPQRSSPPRFVLWRRCRRRKQLLVEYR